MEHVDLRHIPHKEKYKPARVKRRFIARAIRIFHLCAPTTFLVQVKRVASTDQKKRERLLLPTWSRSLKMEKEKEEKEEEEKNTTAPSGDKKTAAAAAATTTTTTTTATTTKKAPTKLDELKKAELKKKLEEELAHKKKKLEKKEEKKKKKTNQNETRPAKKEDEEEGEEEGEEEEEEQQSDAKKLKGRKKMEIGDLKRVVAGNGIAASGSYKTLLQKYSEGSKHGGLPKCPNCKRSGLSIKHDKSMINGEVRCPGHFDKATNSFHKCSFVSPLAEIERPAWKENMEEIRAKTTEEKQTEEVTLSEGEWKEVEVSQTKFNQQKINKKDLLFVFETIIKTKGLIVGGNKIEVGFVINEILSKHIKRGCVSLRPAVEEMLKEYKARTVKITNEANMACHNFLSDIVEQAKAAAAKAKKENVAPTLDAKTVAIVKNGLIVMMKFPLHVDSEAMVDAMMTGGVVDGVEVKKVSDFGDSVANLIKFWIKNQTEEKSALIEMTLSQIQEYAQKKKEQAAATKKKQTTAKPEEQAAATKKQAAATKKQAAATTKKQAAATTKKQAAATTKKQAAAATKKQAAAATKKQAAATTMKRKEKPTKSPTKVSPAEKKTKVAQSQRNANED